MPCLSFCGTLPSTIKTAPSLASFKLGLKTHLFKAVFYYVNNACQYFIFKMYFVLRLSYNFFIYLNFNIDLLIIIIQYSAMSNYAVGMALQKK